MKTLSRNDVDKILKMRAEGYNQTDVAELLDHEGYKNPSGRKLSQTDISHFMCKFGERQLKRRRRRKMRKSAGGGKNVTPISVKRAEPTDQITKILTDLVIGLSAKRKAELLIQLVK